MAVVPRRGILSKHNSKVLRVVISSRPVANVRVVPRKTRVSRRTRHPRPRASQSLPRIPTVPTRYAMTALLTESYRMRRSEICVISREEGVGGGYRRP